MGKKEEKTNVMRLLDQAKIEYKHYCYAGTDACLLYTSPSPRDRG